MIYHSIDLSSKETERYKELKCLEDKFKIQDLKVNQKYPLYPKNEFGKEEVFIARFVYFENGKEIIEVKKANSKEYRLRKRVLQEKYKIEVREI